jgi:protein-S-isoprenylcysteine O-methyltransferase Ste14
VASVADAVIVAAWIVVFGHNAVLAAHGVRRRADVVRWTLGVVLLVAVVAVGVVLERRSGGRLDAPAAAVVLGVIGAVGGALLHVRARRALGAAWSSRPAAGDRLVEHGPYGVVRHPLYLGLALLALGSAVAHPSLPTMAGGLGLLVGLALKLVQEERTLAAAFGPRWAAYRRRVPAVLPRVRWGPSGRA